MDETPGLSDQYRMSSPWPLFVALGIPISELGIVFDVLPVAVGGLLLFAGSVAGLIHEAGYTSTPWRPLAGLALLLAVLGGVFVFTDVRLLTRGVAILVAAGLLLVGSLVGATVVERDTTPV
jgi:hypothetical protein